MKNNLKNLMKEEYIVILNEEVSSVGCRVCVQLGDFFSGSPVFPASRSFAGTKLLQLRVPLSSLRKNVLEPT